MTTKKNPVPGCNQGTGTEKPNSQRSNNTPRRPRSQAPARNSDVAIAESCKTWIESACGKVVKAEGKFWTYQTNCWVEHPIHELKRLVQRYDGKAGGGNEKIRLNRSRINSIIDVLGTMSEEPDFFAAPAVGINCANGFIVFGQAGKPSLRPHDRKHRQRHVLPGSWQPDASSEPPDGSLLQRLLAGVFRGDDDATDKVRLIGELAGCVALGYATRLREPKAIVLHGQTAENGKSQILDMLRSLLPKTGNCSISPQDFRDERHRIGLVNKLLNATDELGGAGAIGEDIFKAIITGEPVSARDVYQPRAEFRAQALHVFATNVLPDFRGGIDRGVRRRLLVIPFNRTIPRAERVEQIGRKIGEQEADALLAFAVEGAGRLIRNRAFSEPPSAVAALRDWASQDPVAAWVEDQVEGRPVEAGQPAIRTRDARHEFCDWAANEGYDPARLPAIDKFTARVRPLLPAGAYYHRTAAGRFFFGIVIRKSANPFRDVARRAAE